MIFDERLHELERIKGLYFEQQEAVDEAEVHERDLLDKDLDRRLTWGKIPNIWLSRAQSALTHVRSCEALFEAAVDDGCFGDEYVASPPAPCWPALLWSAGHAGRPSGCSIAPAPESTQRTSPLATTSTSRTSATMCPSRSRAGTSHR